MSSHQRLLLLLAVLAVTAVAAVNFPFAMAADIVVGGDYNGWRPDVDYNSWADGMDFRVGDKLVFNYTPDDHNVIQVGRAEYETCVAPKGAKVLRAGHDIVSLNTSGKKWFLCGKSNHCSRGQKLAITVIPAITTTQPPLPPTSSSIRIRFYPFGSVMAAVMMMLMVIIVRQCESLFGDSGPQTIPTDSQNFFEYVLEFSPQVPTLNRKRKRKPLDFDRRNHARRLLADRKVNFVDGVLNTVAHLGSRIRSGCQEDEEMLVPQQEFTGGSQRMHVMPGGTDTSFKFLWTIEKLSRFNDKIYSDVFVVGGLKWRVLFFPKGNNVDQLSIYLVVVDSATLPYGWSRDTQFKLSILNYFNYKYRIRKVTQHEFNARESNWGFTSFMPLSEFYEMMGGFLVNESCIFDVEVTARRVVDYWNYDSKKETGYVGLKNQGATCYMNSLLQTLYHTPYFRKAVYHMPTTENDIPSGSIPLALQSLFYKLQYSDNSVATKELTKSFGWDTYDLFTQHDVQEFNRVLCEKLEDKMKGTVVEGTIQHLFEGHHMNYIECISVDYKSTTKESFYDLQLDVKGCPDVYASFDKYVEVERFEGDNKYHAENYGLQDAKKGVLFIDFPPVLQLQLNRFEYDFMQDTMVKINDRYEFPLQLDLDRDNGKYLSLYADRRIRNLYTLHSVLVHSGGVHEGHYYAFIRPTLSDQWFKFDDERVTKEDSKRALEEQYGGEEELLQINPGLNNAPFKFTKYSNAYMLVYIRESDKEKVMCDVDEKDIVEHLRISLKKEQKEKEHKRKEKAEAHLYTIIKVARNEDFAEQIGKEIFFDLVDHDKVWNFRIQKQLPFSHFKHEVAKEFGIPVHFQRFWLWAKRQNHTYRPNRPLTPQEEAQTVGQLREVSKKAHNDELRLFLEVELGQDLRPLPPPPKTQEDILLFFKLYNPEKEQLRFVGRLFVNILGNPIDILSELNEMAGFPPNEEIELYEEIKFEPNVLCEHIDKRMPFGARQLEDGDIICFQRASTIKNGDQYRYPDVPSFLDYVHNRQLPMVVNHFSNTLAVLHIDTF
ncbi:ubiquitin carboxyl-terminal hydrolase 13 [Canna indica]|uniref:Ubiquitin carboxyl-terminal hydrolase 13 n=1 Tax=Canna indica TaxID=4628 RepID=A0AAQ3QH13_9LILI|nr:ubiquitin carboxyl-terminal hydrolase 13 [Canna indica]